MRTKLSIWVAAALLASAASHAADAPQAAASREQIAKRLQAAQERLEQSAQEVAELSLSMNDGNGPMLQRFSLIAPPRVMLGLNIDTREQGANTEQGVRVISVSPGGPAEAAGIKANDVIVSFNGEALRGGDDQSPSQQLLAMTRALKADEPVTVEYRRDGKVQKAQLVPKSLPDIEPPALPDIEGPGRLFGFQRRGLSGFGSAELVELSPGLGKYFGTETGLLVVRAPRDERFKLQDGDVLLDIDGRVPNGVAHAVQILSSYRAGEKLKLHVMRQQKHLELTVEVPEDTERPSASGFVPKLDALPDLPALELPEPPASPVLRERAERPLRGVARQET